jgi:hypothetical protein
MTETKQLATNDDKKWLVDNLEEYTGLPPTLCRLIMSYRLKEVFPLCKVLQPREDRPDNDDHVYTCEHFGSHRRDASDNYYYDFCGLMKVYLGYADLRLGLDPAVARFLRIVPGRTAVCIDCAMEHVRKHGDGVWGETRMLSRTQHPFRAKVYVVPHVADRKKLEWIRREDGILAPIVTP